MVGFEMSMEAEREPGPEGVWASSGVLSMEVITASLGSSLVCVLECQGLLVHKALNKCKASECLRLDLGSSKSFSRKS